MAAPAERMEASRRKHEVAAGVVATVAHLVLLAFAWPLGSEQATESFSDASRGLIDIELPEAEKPPETPPLPTAAPEVEHGTGARTDSRSPGHAREVLPALPQPNGPESAPSASANPAPSASAPPAVTGTYEGPPPAVPMAGGGLTIGTPVWAVPGGMPGGAGSPDTGAGAHGNGTGQSTGPLGRATVAPGKGASVLPEAVRARDRELGLGTPGATAIANAVAEAVRASNVPNESSAVIIAQIGGDGALLSITVQRMSAGDARSWNGVAQAATAAIGKKKLGIAGLGPRGAVVQISVRSSVTYPSGSRDKATGIVPSLTSGPPRDVAPAPSPDGDACAPERYSFVKPLCGVGMNIASFDSSDVVANKHRAVRTSFHVKLLDDVLALAAPPASPPVAPSASAAPSAPVPSATAASPRASAAPSADAGAP